MTRLDLPDGQWAELADPRKVPEKKRARYRRSHFAFSAATADLPRMGDDKNVPDPRYLDDTAAELADNIAALLMVCLVREWSYGEVTVDVLDGLPADAYDQLLRACTPLATELMPSYEADVDPKARTAVSSPPPTPSLQVAPIYATTSTDGTS